MVCYSGPMHIEWNRVTWYSKLAAIIIFLATAGLFFWIGEAYGSARAILNLSSRQVSISSQTTAGLSEPTSTLVAASPLNGAGTYDAKEGVGTIVVTQTSVGGIHLEGQTAFGGPGNMANDATAEAHTSVLDADITVSNNKGIYTDPSNSSCTVAFLFGVNSLTVQSNDDCDISLYAFSGEYTKDNQ